MHKFHIHIRLIRSVTPKDMRSPPVIHSGPASRGFEKVITIKRYLCREFKIHLRSKQDSTILNTKLESFSIRMNGSDGIDRNNSVHCNTL